MVANGCAFLNHIVKPLTCWLVSQFPKGLFLIKVKSSTWEALPRSSDHSPCCLKYLCAIAKESTPAGAPAYAVTCSKTS